MPFLLRRVSKLCLTHEAVMALLFCGLLAYLTFLVTPQPAYAGRTLYGCSLVASGTGPGTFYSGTATVPSGPTWVLAHIVGTLVGVDLGDSGQCSWGFVEYSTDGGGSWTSLGIDYSGWSSKSVNEWLEVPAGSLVRLKIISEAQGRYSEIRLTQFLVPDDTVADGVSLSPTTYSAGWYYSSEYVVPSGYELVAVQVQGFSYLTWYMKAYLEGWNGSSWVALGYLEYGSGYLYYYTTSTMGSIVPLSTYASRGELAHNPFYAYVPPGISKIRMRSSHSGQGVVSKVVLYPSSAPTITGVFSGGLGWSNQAGRGWVRVEWAPKPRVAGYRVCVVDGRDWRQFDVGNRTYFDTREEKIYPSESWLDSLADNSYTGDPFNHTRGGLDLRDDNNKLFRKMQTDPSWKDKHHYEFIVLAYNASGVSPWPWESGVWGWNGGHSSWVTLPNRTDTQAPQVTSLSINDGAANAGSRNVTLTIAGSDPTQASYEDTWVRSKLAWLEVSNDNFATKQSYRVGGYLPDRDEDRIGDSGNLRVWTRRVWWADVPNVWFHVGTWGGSGADHYHGVTVAENLNLPVTADMYLSYGLYLNQQSNLRVTVQFQMTDGKWTWELPECVDQNGIPALGPNGWGYDLNSRAYNQVYYRQISLAPLAGRSISKIVIWINDNPGVPDGDYYGHIKNIRIGPAWLTDISQENVWRIPWTLTAGEGTKTVSVRFVDYAGNVSPVQSASIYLINDTQPPSVSVTVNGGAAVTTSQYVDLAVEAQDNLSTPDMLQMRLSADGGQTWGGWGTYAVQVKGFDLGSTGGPKTVCAQVKDANGNVGTGVATIYYAKPGEATSTPSDSTPPPTGGSQVGENLNGVAIMLNGQPTVVVQGDSITLSLSNINTQAGPVQLYVSFDGVNWSPPDQIPTGQTTFSKVLTFPREGTIAVSYKLKNSYGAESPVYTRYYLVDYTAPVIEKAEVLGGLTAVTSSTAPLLLRARDNLKAGMYYSLSLDGSTWTSWAALPSDGVVNSPTLASGYNRVRVKVIDRAGNAASATVGVFKL